MASLLLGNGINYLSTRSVSWDALLKDLMNNIQKQAVTTLNTEVPYLHIYEDIFTKGFEFYGKEESKVKESIATKIKDITPNKYHKKIMNLNFENILTTNYDYTLTPKSVKKKGKGERKFSLKRFQEYRGKKVWHIHGEINMPDSIMLGYSHYMESVAKMHINLSQKQRREDTWMDIFLNDDIYILGMGLDFGEVDLWWLLALRNREILGKERKRKNIVYINMEYSSSTPEIINQCRENIYKNINNFNIWKSECEDLVKMTQKAAIETYYNDKNQAKLSMLRTFGAEIKTIKYYDSNDRTVVYDEAIEYMENELQKKK